MKATVLFFGATAEVAGRRRIEVDIRPGTTTTEIYRQMLEDFPGLKTHKLLFSLNQSYVEGEAAISDGDELALFTAVSGG